MKFVLARRLGSGGDRDRPRLGRAGHEIVVLSRGSIAAGCARALAWDGRTLGPSAEELDDAAGVINVAGRSVNCRYTREPPLDHGLAVDSTRVIGEAIARAALPPRVWLQSSTATIYAHRLDAAHDEQTGILGGDEPGALDTWRFSIDVPRWERALDEAQTPQTCKIAMRSRWS